jgi:hypothetical protein
MDREEKSFPQFYSTIHARMAANGTQQTSTTANARCERKRIFGINFARHKLMLVNGVKTQPFVSTALPQGDYR